MTKRQRRLLIIAIVLALILLGLFGYYSYYRATKTLSFNFTGSGTGQVIEPPQFLYSFSGAEPNRLLNPLAVLVDGGRVFVTDAKTGKIQVFNEAGRWQRSFGSTESVTPLYIAKNPKDGNIYVSDRRQRAVHKYSVAGKYLGDFNPNLPKEQLPDFKTGGVQWVPNAIAFGKDGTMYVTDFLKGHRVLIFGPDGTFKRSVGTAVIVLKPETAPGVFQFPNGLMIQGNELYVADSNNRRVQVFSLAGDHKRTIVTQGLPRGIAPLGRFPSDTSPATARFVAIDTLAHDATLWTSKKGTKILSFGEQGVLDGQFNYPNGAAVGTRNRIYIADTSNGRVQVWGWPDQVARVPVVGSPSRLPYCLIPLLLLPLLLLLRRRRIYATAEFVRSMVDMGEEGLLSSVRRVKWVTTEDQHPGILEAAGSDVADLFDVWEHSEPDVQALMSKYEVDHDVAVIVAVAQRTRLFCTDDEALRTLATKMEIATMNAAEFVERYGKKRAVSESEEQ